MGCDIHMFLEYKCGNGMPWQADDHHVKPWEDRCKDDNTIDPTNWCNDCKNNSDETQLHCERGYLDFQQINATCRNYNLFAALAGVRGSGGRDALGLPDDVSATIKEASERWGSDGHSHSYISLEEFKKVCFDEMDYKPSTSYAAFYEYASIPWDKHPPAYTTIINYAEKLKQENSIDKVILGSDTSSEVQVRLVFWFDN